MNLFRKYADSFVPAHALHPVDVVFGAVAFAAPLVVWRAVPGFRRVLGWLTLGLAGALGVVAFVVRSRGHSIGLVSVWSARGRNAILVGAAAGFVLVAVFVTVRDRLRRVTSPRPPTRRVIAVIVPFLVLMPLAGAVGTGNTLVLGILICAAPWGAALVLALAWLMRREPGSGGLPIAQAALCILAVALCAQVLENVVLFPYIDRGSTTKNVASADGLPGLEGALLDPNTKTYLDSVREEVFAHTGFQPGDTVLIFEPAAAGPVLAVGGTLPESIYPLSGESNICEAWTRAADEVRSATLAFVREGAAPADLTSCVSRLRSDFPAGFVEVGSVETPEGSHLLILAPANQVH